MAGAARLGILFRGDRDLRRTATAENTRLRPVFEALAANGVQAEPVVYAEEFDDEARSQLQQLGGVLVWVDPISGGRDRLRLDALLRDVGSRGVWVSAHPDVVLKMGTKDVLFETRGLGWGTDTHLYRDMASFWAEFPARLASAGPRVLKQHRGNGGIGVWKAELVDAAAGTPGMDATVRVQHARDRGTQTEEMPLAAFIDRCAEYFAGDGRLIDQPYVPRVAEGMVRCYMAGGAVAGFARQFAADDAVAAARVLGLPAAKTMYGSGEPAFQALRWHMESEWVPSLQRVVGVDTASLPAIWDADFLCGPKTAAGDDTYVLCEINVSSCYPLPQEAIAALARIAAARVRAGQK